MQAMLIGDILKVQNETLFFLRKKSLSPKSHPDEPDV